MATDHRLSIVDFTDRAHPRLAAEAEPPLWTMKELTMFGRDIYVLGTKKSLPIDEVKIAVAHPDSAGIRLDERITLGPEGAVYVNGALSISGGLLFASVVHARECRLEVYDLASGRQAAAVTVEEVKPPIKRVRDAIPIGGPLPICFDALRLDGLRRIEPRATGG